MESTPKIKRDLWKICNKIREVVNHIKFNFWEYYSTYDVKQTGYVTVFIFKNVLDGPLKTTINLSDEEIQLLENYFENPNGQVQYGKFCQMIHNESNLKKEPTKIENTINLNYTKQDLPRLNVMKKIARDLNTLHILLEPYFEDYEELTGNNGLMTIKQFKDMFYALKLQISPQEMQLIINKFIVFSYMIDKKQFFDELNWVQINEPQSFFTKVIKDDFKEKNTRLYSNQNVFHPVISSKTQKKDNVITILRNIQKHVLENRIYIGQFFEPFDPFRKGYVSEKEFRRCLDMIGVSSIHCLYYSEEELSLLLQMYKDKEHPERVQWKKFEDQINTVFTEKKSETNSDVEIKCSLNTLDMLRIRGQDWEAVELSLRKLFNETMVNIRNYLNQRRILLDQYFKIFDKNNHGHISRSDFRRAMFTASIQCTEEELGILEKRFMNVDGFNYLEFFKMLDDIDKSVKQCSTRHDLNTYNDEFSSESVDEMNDTTINKLMTKIKTIVKRGRIKVDQFLSQFDILNHKVMPKNSFQRALGMAGINVDSNELEVLFNEYDSKTHPGCVEYRRFCDAADAAFVTPGLHRTPSARPGQFLPTYEAPANRLTDGERRAVDAALLKLRSKPNIGLDDLFADYDRMRQGVVSMTGFLGALTVRKLNMLLSAHEIKCLMKAFSKGGHRPITFNYRAFMKTIECT